MNSVLSEPATTAAEPTQAPATAGAAWRVYQTVSTGPVSENELIERYLPLVRNVVDRIKINLPAHVDADDLYSVGITGLLAAVRKYDPSQNTTFAGYANTRIRGAILDELRRMDWCPRRARAKAKKIKESINTIEQRVKRAASEEEIRAELGLSAKDYAKWVEESRPVCFVAIDQPGENEEGGGASLHEIIADQSEIPVRDRLEQEELMQLVARCIEALPPIPRKILAMYYHENLRLAEIAAVFSLTESRICQIHSQTVLSLRAMIQRERDR
ncbi:FliA/WhiG family RNA polymerase sigma factor [Rariglobus hedericola]|uniref:FliA/WhiG family RNA polymerase sigma factor n=1 Tax=Rariglobus hedericola TaxID=2597822 RepID=A0A556QPR4_9BACT|nr:FliA/WhiG family RNA polymerase sigma factor [Rariglobus hedericola]TSJ78638.1 FliA/WhiG family RNA polymerase sigma factor [Rariglobus hedericola]